MRILVFISILCCKLSGFILRVAGRGGTNLPGKIALKICPNVLRYMSRGVTTLVVTGTNGKTTTSRMLEECYKRAGFDYFANKSGANLLSGVTAEFARNSNLFGKNKHKYALIECDEAAFKQVSRFVDAKCIIVTNIFRDQLDRYGEITHTLNSIEISVKNSPNATLCLNADCSLTSSLAEFAGKDIVWYGLETPIYKDGAVELSDAMYCLKCKHPYKYDYHTFAHLGAWRCENCGYSRTEPEVAVTQVLETRADSSLVRLRLKDGEHDVAVNLPGGYNIYNAAAAAAAAQVMGIAPETIVQALGGFECGFGRAEKFSVNGADVRMMLVKNPAGFNQVLTFLTNTGVRANLVFVLNDRYADGTDISWIWDVDFERVAACRDRFSGIYVSGVRADDMALRLKYAGIPVGDIQLVRDYGELIRRMTETGEPVYMLPTYTAMFDLRLELGKVVDMKAFWE